MVIKGALLLKYIRYLHLIDTHFCILLCVSIDSRGQATSTIYGVRHVCSASGDIRIQNLRFSNMKAGSLIHPEMLTNF